jgi:hypothetical protein
MVHCRSEIEAPKSSLIDGSATLMTVVSMLTMNRLMQQIPSTRNRRRRLNGGDVMGAMLAPIAL